MSKRIVRTITIAMAAALMAALAAAQPEQSWRSGEYSYDGVGNILKIGTTTIPNGDGLQNTYVYDSLGRLVRAKVASGTATHEQLFEYDAYGNLTKVTTDGVVQPIGVSPSSNRLTDVPQGAYDEAGNLRLNNGNRYEYDAAGLMREKVGGNGLDELYVYTADDERIGVRVAADEWHWTIRDLGGKPLREWRGWQTSGWAQPWVWLEDHVWANGQLIGSERPPESGGRQHLHLDHLGTPRLATGTNGLLAARHDYYPFGREITSLRQDMAKGFPREETMKFTGHERDFTGGTAVENTDYLDYMHARSYSPNWGRFVSVDQGISTSSQPQTWNRFTYALNSPLRLIDPDGREADRKSVV